MHKSFYIRLALGLACLTTFVGCKTNPTAMASPKPMASPTPVVSPTPVASRAPVASPQPVKRGPKFTYVIVHGAWGGGWDWKHVDQLLTADGHKVYRPTLTGQGEHSNLASTNIDLDTHIQDIVNVIVWEDLHDVVLVGHSYGGMVVTGVADRVPDRIRCLIYVDALLPENGENADTIISPKLKKPVKDGFVTCPWVTNNPPPPHDVLMPAKTFSEPITLTNQAVAKKLSTIYILTVDAGTPDEQDDFYPFYQRAQARGWSAIIMQADHNPQRSHANGLAVLLEQMP
jgi:pimeloyl-ACP methyl ester carboxylesterase